MVYVRQLSTVERQELRRQTRRAVGRVSERIHMILLSDRHYTVLQIAELFECSEATVRTYIERFEADGLQGLQDRPRCGRPRKADAAAQDVIRQELAKPPETLGHHFGFWTLVTLCAHLATVFGLRLSRATLRRNLLALDFRWRRPKHALPHDPEAGPKLWALCDRLLRAPQEAVLLCTDECDVHLLPVLRAMWMPKGQQVRVPTPGANRKRSIFGALALETGRWLYTVCERKRALEFIAFLEPLVAAYPDRPLLLVLDNASIHKAKAVAQWLTAHTHVELRHLPTYSGHQENPVEKVWWRLKDRVAANRLHKDIDGLVATVHDFFASFTPDAALQLAA